MTGNKILFVITTYNQSKYTKLCLESVQGKTNFDLLVVDDASTDDTIELCNAHDVKCLTKSKGAGLTDSWNIAYKYFKENQYDYLIIANNDILVPDGAITELKNVLDIWPCSLVVPMTTQTGAGHNPIQSINNWYGENEYHEPSNYQQVQSYLLEALEAEKVSNNLYKFDPIRMKMFNGFFFMMSKKICQYEREDGNLFDPSYINVKNEDEFNWGNLIPNNDYAMLCKTAFIFHWKGVSFTKAGLKYSNDINEHMEQRENKFNTTIEK